MQWIGLCFLKSVFHNLLSNIKRLVHLLILNWSPESKVLSKLFWAESSSNIFLN